MIYGVVIATGTGTLLFEKTWAQLPAHSRVFESKKSIIVALLTTLQVFSKKATNGLNLSHISFNGLSFTIITSASPSKPSTKSSSSSSSTSAATAAGAAAAPSSAISIPTTSSVTSSPSTEKPDLTSEKVDGDVTTTSVDDEIERGRLRCVVLHDNEDGYELGKIIGIRLLTCFCKTFSAADFTSVIRTSTFTSFSGKLIGAIEAADKDVLTDLRYTPGIVNALLAYHDDCGKITAAVPVEEISLAAYLRSLLTFSDDCCK